MKNSEMVSIIKAVLNGQKVVSYYEFEKIIINYFSQIQKKIDKDAKFVVSSKINHYGECIGNKIKINSKIIKGIYYKKSKFAFFPIFHEFIHFSYNCDINSGIYSDTTIKIIKEGIINYELEKQMKMGDNKYKNNISYYDRNYNLVFSENLANKEGILLTVGFLENLGIDISTKERKIILEAIRDFELEFNNKYRRIKGGKYMLVDDILADVIKDAPEYLEIFPFLNDEYYISGNNVERRSVRR